MKSGLRRKGLKNICQIADYVANKTSLKIFLKVDRVIVFTSLGVFEALIRGIPVTTYGFPFYSGWGITEDKVINNSWKRRRTRKLTVEELIYITLIEYPLYFSLKNNTFTDIEHIIDELNSNKNKNKNLEQIIFRYWGIIKDLISRSK